MVNRAPLLLFFALALALLGLALLFVFFSPFPTDAQAPPTFTPAPTLTPIPTYTPPPTSPGGGGGGRPGYLQVRWLTGTIGDNCGLSWMFYPSSYFSMTVYPRDRVVVSGSMILCVPDHRELIYGLTLRASSSLSHTADVYFIVGLYGRSSEVKIELKGTCPDGIGSDCRYYRNVVGSGVYHFVISYTMPPRVPPYYYLEAICDYWEKDRPGTVDCLVWVNFSFFCGGGCHNPPNEPLCYCSGPGECEVAGDYVRVRSTGPVSPLFNVHLPLGYDIYDVPEIPATYEIRGVTPTSFLTLYADTPMRYNLYSFECVFPEWGFNTHEYSFYAPGGYHEIRADCASYWIPGLGIHPPYIYVQGIPLNYVTLLTCNVPFTPTLTNDLGPHDSGRSLWTFLPDYEFRAVPPPGYPTDYAWISYSGMISAFGNAFDFDEYWLFSASLPPTRPFLPPVGGGDFITWTDGISTCISFPPLNEQINAVLDLVGLDPLPTFSLCVVPRLFRFVNVPFANFLLDEAAAFFVASAALYVWRIVRSRIS